MKVWDRVKRVVKNILPDDDGVTPQYIWNALVGLAIAGTVDLFWPKVLPFRLFSLWLVRCSFVQMLMAVSYLMLWGLLLQSYISWRTRNRSEINEQAEKILLQGVIRSVKAGIFEELSFRWLFFAGSIATSMVFNYLTFGLVAWFQIHCVGPVVNFVTSGWLQEYLVGAAAWTTSIGICHSNLKFREGHSYQGTIGYINSWYLGFYFFWLTLHYGLPIAIVAHSCYNLTVYGVCYVDSVIERRQNHQP